MPDFAGVPLLALWGLVSPSALGLMSRQVGAGEQGRLQGANASIASLCGIFAPALFTQTFAMTLHTIPGTAFMMAGTMLLAAMAIGWRVTKAG